MQVDDVATEYEQVKNNKLAMERAIQYAHTQNAQCVIGNTGMFDEEALGRAMGSYSRSNKNIEWLCIIAGKRMQKKADPRAVGQCWRQRE
ncbi:MAG: hypothetical protein KatS3mg031_1497 [Chitinophagales bacterium]|nr:MAG: hypothetical protein KatS3mg031_1497 [Chitinophagales bacterium]